MNIATMMMDRMDAGVAVFFFLAIGAIALFTFLSVATWTGTRQNEREAYYKAEMLKKIQERVIQSKNRRDTQSKIRSVK